MSSLQKIAQKALKHAWAFWLTLLILPLIQVFWNNALTPARDFPDIFSKSLLAFLFLPGRNISLTLSVLALLVLLNVFAWLLARPRGQTGAGQHPAIRTPAPRAQQEAPDAFLLSLAWSPDGTYLASAGSEGVVELWDGKTLTDGKQLAPEDEPVDWLRSLVWSSDSHLLAAGGEDGRSRVWNVVTGDVQHVLPHPTSPLYALGWSSQGVLVATEDGGAFVFSPTTGRGQQLLAGGLPLHLAAWSWRSGLLARVSVDGTVEIWRESGTQKVTILNPETQQARVLSWNAADTCFAIGYEDGTVQIWNVNPPAKLGEWQTEQHDVQAICWLPKGHLLVSAGGDGILKIWQIPTGRLQHEIATSQGPITACAVSPDAQFLCSAHEKGALALWEIPKHVR